jgi:UDP-N-acetylglucosamine:LPS N-acetylglucosamine transferase
MLKIAKIVIHMTNNYPTPINKTVYSYFKKVAEGFELHVA